MADKPRRWLSSPAARRLKPGMTRLSEPISADSRVQAAHVDIGAYELDLSGFPALSVAALGQTLGSPSPVTGDFPVTFSAAVNPGGLATVASVQYGLSTELWRQFQPGLPLLWAHPVDIEQCG